MTMIICLNLYICDIYVATALYIYSVVATMSNINIYMTLDNV